MLHQCGVSVLSWLLWRWSHTLNPVEEVVEDTEEDLKDHIVAIYDGYEREYETEEKEVIVSRVME